MRFFTSDVGEVSVSVTDGSNNITRLFPYEIAAFLSFSLERDIQIRHISINR